MAVLFVFRFELDYLPEKVHPGGATCRFSLHGSTSACLVMVAYRHGLRAKEACELEWSQVEFGRSAAVHVRGPKRGSRPFIRSAAMSCAC